jgi:hypothetical protein
MSVALDYTKDPDAKLDFPIDWTDWLGADTITASTWIVPAGLVKESEVTQADETTVWVSGGTDGAVYVITNRITTAQGRVNEASIRLRVISEEASLAPIALLRLVNSFQTYPEAIQLSREIPGLVAWGAKTDIERSAALVEAYERLIRLGYRIPRPEVDTMDRIDSGLALDLSPRHWEIMTIGDFDGLPARFTRALRKAQIAEAEDILGGDVIAGRRKAGLLSESVGESSMMFRTGKPLNLGISGAALAYLTGYINIRMTTVRS